MRALISVSVLALLITACGGDGDASPGEPETVTQTVEVPTPTADPTEAQTTDAEQFEPSVGEDALTVGDARVGRVTTTTLLELRDPYPPAEYREPQRGQRFVGLRVSQCVVDDYDGSEGDVLATFNGDWVAVTADNDEYPGSGSGWIDWPLPKFPENATIPAGGCVKGWMTVELPERLRYDKFVWRPDGTTTAEWFAK
jgi:hypothetical protein